MPTTSLAPVIELSSTKFATTKRPSPKGSWAENPDGWRTLWAESLADAGITGLVQMAAGFELVALSQLTPDILRIVLRKVLGRRHRELEELPALAGGFVLQVGSVVIAPGCCSDLGNFEEWRLAAECTSTDWQMLSIGHPWSHVRATGDLLHVAEPNEQIQTEGLVAALQVDRADLRVAVARAGAELVHFENLLTPVVAELLPHLSARAAPNVTQNPARAAVRSLLYGDPDDAPTD